MHKRRPGASRCVPDAVGLAAGDVRLYADLTPVENLRFLMAARGERADNDRLVRILQDVGLAHRADDPVRELSSGMRQRASLAAALVHRPPVLLLDEPTTNLDEDGVRVVHSIIAAQREWGMVVLATNDPADTCLGDSLLQLPASEYGRDTCQSRAGGLR